MPEQPQEQVRITDKRKKAKGEMPTAQELLDDVNEIETNRKADAHRAEESERQDTQSEFERQKREAEEDARRAAEFEALPEEEKQRILAEQAANSENIPYQGAGVQTDGEVVQEMMTAFTIVIGLDGEATAMPVPEFNKHNWRFQREVNPRMMYRACSEIVLDVQAAETAKVTLAMMNAVGAQMAEAQRAAAIQQQLAQRGMRAPGR